MDLKALQTTLREFAAEREWQPFHTPKNLAMALMVEAAELSENFQWMTPEQSQAARGDLVLQEQVADEAADVLLYLSRQSRNQTGNTMGGEPVVRRATMAATALIERYAPNLHGVLSCYDRLIVTGTLPGACYAGAG